jgi:hypothetical protein
MEWHLTLPYWLTVGAALLSVWFAQMLPALDLGSQKLSLGQVRGQLAAVFGTFRYSPFLVLVILQGIATFVLGRILQVNLFQPILKSKGFSVGSFGLVMALMTAFEAVGSARPGWVRRWLDDFQAVFVLTIALAASLWVIPSSGPVATLCLLVGFAYGMGLEYPIQRQLINDAIPDSRHRATIMSIESIVDRATNAGLAAMIGGYLEAGRLDDFLELSSGLTVLSMGILWVLTGLAASRRPPA